MELFDIIKNRPMEYTSALTECVFCNSKNLTAKSTITTLVGGPKGTNHEWHPYQCNDCNQSFTLEEKSLNSWITKTEKVLLSPSEMIDSAIDNGIPFPIKKNITIILEGVASCFEDYIYQCVKCDGEVTRKYIDKKTNKPSLVLGKDLKTGEKSYITLYTCDKCGHGGETEEDYYCPPKKESKEPKKKIDWNKVTFEVEPDLEAYTNDFKKFLSVEAIDSSQMTAIYSDSFVDEEKYISKQIEKEISCYSEKTLAKYKDKKINKDYYGTISATELLEVIENKNK